MDNQQVFELPYPPSNNTYYRNTARGVLLSAKARTYHAMAMAELIRQHIKSVDGFVSVEFLIYPPDRRRRDLDNCAKCLCDSLQKCGIIHDDSDIMDLRLTWAPAIKHGKVVVILTGGLEDARVRMPCLPRSR